MISGSDPFRVVVGWAARMLSLAEGLVERPLGVLCLFGIALADYVVQALAWPLIGGDDLDEYLYYFVQLPDAHPLLPWPQLFRTPLTPIVVGGSLDLWHGVLAEPLAGVLFAGSVVAWSVVGRTFGPRVALLAALTLLLYPGYGGIFHKWASEPVFAACFALWAWFFTRAAVKPSPARFAFAGVGAALVTLARPGDIVIVVFALFPLTLSGAWRRRVGWAASYLVAAALPLFGLVLNNGVRYGDYTLARGGNALIPFYRTFLSDHIVSPTNGPASRKLARAVAQHLLTRNPYKAYDITLHDFFSEGDFRMHEDLYNLSDQVWGWGSAYSTLRAAGLEAIRKHPGKYAGDVLGTIWEELHEPSYRVTANAAGSNSQKTGSRALASAASPLPPPSEGEPIPPGQNAWISRPDNAIRQVWTGPTTYRFVFATRAEALRFVQIQRRLGSLFSHFPNRTSNAALAQRLNQLSRWYPRLYMWLLVGLLFLPIRRPRYSGTLLAIAAAALLVVILNALGLPTTVRFILPVAPAFILFGAAALLGRRQQV